MWVIVHMLTGLALGTLLFKFDVPLAIIIMIALIFHLILDIMPHWDYTETASKEWWAGFDVLLSALLVVAILSYQNFSLPAAAVWSGIVSALPDIDVLQLLLPNKKKWKPFNRRIFPSHWERFPHGRATDKKGNPNKLGGLIAQLIVVLMSIAIIYGYK